MLASLAHRLALPLLGVAVSSCAVATPALECPAPPASPSAPSCSAPEPQEPEPEPQPKELEPEPRAFEPVSITSRAAKVALDRKTRHCGVKAVLDPEAIALYTPLDVYATLALGVEVSTDLPDHVANWRCADGSCPTAQPRAVLVHDGDAWDQVPLNGFAVGFVIPLGSGYWVLPLTDHYRVYFCYPRFELEPLTEDHARITVLHNHAEGEPCDEDDEDESACGVGCFHPRATQYDLFYDPAEGQALLVTREFRLDPDSNEEPLDRIELTREANGLHIEGCRIDETLPWPVLP